MFFLLHVAYRKLKEKIKERRLLKKHPFFAKVDQAISKSYQNKNPYHLCHRFFEQRGDSNPFVYGETPLIVFDKIATFLKLKEDDVFVDLGCGRGRGLFYLNGVYKLKCIGYDIVEDFIILGNALAKKENLSSKVIFEKKDIAKEPLPTACAIYLAGTCMLDEEIRQVAQKLSHTCAKTTIVTVSFPLSDYFPSFSIVNTLEVEFLWGKTTLYFQTTV